MLAADARNGGVPLTNWENREVHQNDVSESDATRGLHSRDLVGPGGRRPCADRRNRHPQPPQGKLRLATCQFPVSGDIAANADWIRRQIREAHDRDADLVHFPECALSGYAGNDFKSLADLNWDLLRKETESVMALAKELQVWVVLGSTHRLSGDHKPHNCLYVINPQGQIADRYDKRFCTQSDLRYYSPGDHFVTFDVNGVKCGLLICYDVRFPELYRQYAKLGVQLMLHSFYNAKAKSESIHPKIMPPDRPGLCRRELHVRFDEQLVGAAQLAEPLHHARRTGGRRASAGRARRDGQPGRHRRRSTTTPAGPSGWIASTASSTAARRWTIRGRRSGRATEVRQPLPCCDAPSSPAKRAANGGVSALSRTRRSSAFEASAPPPSGSETAASTEPVEANTAGPVEVRAVAGGGRCGTVLAPPLANRSSTPPVATRERNPDCSL